MREREREDYTLNHTWESIKEREREREREREGSGRGERDIESEYK